MLLALGQLALCLLIFLHGFALFLGCLFLRFLVLLGRPLRLLTIFSDAPVFALSVGRYRPCDTESGQQYEGGDSFHNISEWEEHCSDFSTRTMARRRNQVTTVFVCGRWASPLRLAALAQAGSGLGSRGCCLHVGSGTLRGGEGEEERGAVG